MIDATFLKKVNAVVDRLPIFTVKEVLVVCIEEDSMKFVEMSLSQHNPVVQNFAVVPVGVIEEEGDTVKHYSELFKKAYTQGGFKAQYVFALLVGGSVFLRKISLPEIPSHELAKAIRWEAANHIPFNIDTAYFDWAFLTSVVTREGVKNNEYMIAAASKKSIEALVDMVDGAKLNLVCVGLPGFAIRNIVDRSEQFSKEKTIAVVDIGEKKTNIVVFKGKILCFAREIPVGVTTLDDILKSELQSNFESLRSEQIVDFLRIIKLKYDVLTNTAASEPLIAGIANQRIYGAFGSFLDRLISDMRRSFEYIKSQVNGMVIDKIVVSGVGARLKNVDQYMKRSINMQTEIMDMAGVFNVADTINKEIFHHNCHELFLLVGCALGGFNQINFMPTSFMAKRRTVLYSVVAACLVLVSLVVGFIVGFSLDARIAQVSDTLYAESAKIKDLEPQVASLQVLCEQYLTMKRIYDVIGENSVVMSAVLRDIVIRMPDTISLKNIGLQNGVCILEGYVFENVDSNQARENMLLDFTILLNESAFIQNADLVSSETGRVFDVPHNVFTVHCKVASRNDIMRQPQPQS